MVVVGRRKELSHHTHNAGQLRVERAIREIRSRQIEKMMVVPKRKIVSK